MVRVKKTSKDDNELDETISDVLIEYTEKDDKEQLEHLSQEMNGFKSILFDQVLDYTVFSKKKNN